MIIEWSDCGTGNWDSFEAFNKDHPGAIIDAIDGRYCHGRCEGCGKPILDGDLYQPWEEGVITCSSCSDTERLVTAE